MPFPGWIPSGLHGKQDVTGSCRKSFVVLLTSSACRSFSPHFFSFFFSLFFLRQNCSIGSQEVDRLDYFEPELKALGYVGHVQLKHGSKDGPAMFFNSERLMQFDFLVAQSLARNE